MLQKTELTEYCSAVARSILPNGPARVEVVDPLAVGDAVARIDEGRARLPAARGEGGRRGHDLEDRARRIEALRGPVDERRRGPAVGGDRADPAEVALDEVRVVARRRGHHEQLPAPRVDRRHGAAAAAELLERDLLGVQVERRHDRVADDRLVAKVVELALDEVGEVALRAGEHAVERLLEPRAGPRDGRVADDVRGEAALRVPAEVERPAAAAHRPVAREHAPRREDQPALHLELLDALDLVVLPRGEPRPRPGLPVRRADHERDDERHRRPRDAGQLPVHVGAPRTARFETSITSASITKFETMLEPP